MPARHFTIARGMVATAVVAANLALARAFLVREMFEGVILLLVALQVGLVALLACRGRARRFWLGFEAAGVVTIFALLGCETFPDSAASRRVMAAIFAVAGLLLRWVPSAVEDHLMEDQRTLFAVAHFLPELGVALAGGLIALATAASRTGPPPSEVRKGPLNDPHRPAAGSGIAFSRGLGQNAGPRRRPATALRPHQGPDHPGA